MLGCMVSPPFEAKDPRLEAADSVPPADAYTNAKLASVSASSLKAKNRKLELHNPDLQLPFEFSGTL